MDGDARGGAERGIGGGKGRETEEGKGRILNREQQNRTLHAETTVQLAIMGGYRTSQPYITAGWSRDTKHVTAACCSPTNHPVMAMQ